MNEFMELSEMLNHLMINSRIRDLTHYALGDRNDRIGRIAAIISKLSSGWYLVGVGPHFCDIIRVGKEEITIGRTASVLEESLDSVIDYFVNDATLTGPREVSRLHLTARVDLENNVLEVRDEQSSTGTWLASANEPLDPGIWHPIESGQSFGLGPTQVNMFVAVLVGQKS